MEARLLQIELGYKKWENFYNIIKKAISLVSNNPLYSFKETYIYVTTGFGAKRKIIDYDLNEMDVELIKRLTGAMKPNGYHKISSETIIVESLQRYYNSRNIKVVFQFRLESYVYDCLINNNILFEYDEPYHLYNRQKKIDYIKDKLAYDNNYNIVRATVGDDIIDIIIKINSLI